MWEFIKGLIIHFKLKLVLRFFHYIFFSKKAGNFLSHSRWKFPWLHKLWTSTVQDDLYLISLIIFLKLIKTLINNSKSFINTPRTKALEYYLNLKTQKAFHICIQNGSTFIRYQNIEAFALPRVTRKLTKRTKKLRSDSFKSILITVSHHMGLYANALCSGKFARAFHMEIDSLSFFNFPIEFYTHNTSNQKSHFHNQSMEMGSICMFILARLIRSEKVIWWEAFKLVKPDLHCCISRLKWMLEPFSCCSDFLPSTRIPPIEKH